MAWKRIVREYFSYNKRERNGLILLSTFVFLVILARLVVAFWPSQPYSFSEKELTEFNELVAASSEINRIDKQLNQTNLDDSSLTASNSFQIYPFDPNQATLSFYDSAGLNENSSRMLLKYIQAGGRINSKEDLLKIYFMDTAWVDSVSDFFLFPQIETESYRQNWKSESDDLEFKKSTAKPIQQVRFDLNTIDSSTLESIPGLGPFYTKEILKLRSRLGGIRNYGQLTDIYKMRDQTIEILSERTFIDTASFQFIDINLVDVGRLGRHPYLTWKQAKVIVNYRFQHGPFIKVEDIKKTGVVNDSVYRIIEPYLRIK